MNPRDAEIYDRYHRGEVTYSDLSHEYGLSITRIGQIMQKERRTRAKHERIRRAWSELGIEYDPTTKKFS